MKEILATLAIALLILVSGCESVSGGEVIGGVLQGIGMGLSGL